MNIEDLRTLLDYHYWARDRMFEALEPLTTEQATRSLGGSFTSIHDTVAHLYAADAVWYARWQGESPAALLTGAAFPDLAAVRRVWTEHEPKMRAFVEELGEAGIYLLEVNTQPGMTPLSLVPEQAKLKGIPYGELVERLMAEALK